MKISVKYEVGTTVEFFHRGNWMTGTITFIDEKNQEIFVNSNNEEYQIDLSDYPRALKFLIKEEV